MFELNNLSLSFIALAALIGLGAWAAARQRRFALAGALAGLALIAAAPARVGLPMAFNNRELAMMPSSALFPVLRLSVSVSGDAAPLWFSLSPSSCPARGYAADGYLCRTLADGGSALAMPERGIIDIREAGAVADDRTPNDAAVANAIAFAKVTKACAFVPAVAKPFRMNDEIAGGPGSSPCLKGPRIMGYGGAATPDEDCQLHFARNTSGLDLNRSYYGWDIEDLSLCGNAAESSVATQTSGLIINQTGEGVIKDIYIQDFVVCRQHVGGQGRTLISGVHCNDQQRYPNIINGFPLACVQAIAGLRAATAASQWAGDECREQSWTTDKAYTGDGSTTDFDIAANPHGFQLFAADGVKVRVGYGSPRFPNGFVLRNGPLAACGVNYTVWDMGADGFTRGSGGVQLYCAKKTILVDKTRNVAIVNGCFGNGCALTGDIPTPPGQPPYNLQLISDHGLAIDTRIAAVNRQSNQIALSAKPLITGTLTVEIVQIGVAANGAILTGAAINGTNLTFASATGTVEAGEVVHDTAGDVAPNTVIIAGSGANWRVNVAQTLSPETMTTDQGKSCREGGTCGKNIEIRFASPPAISAHIALQWFDPTGRVAYDIENGSDYLTATPVHVGGYRTILKYTAIAYGGITLTPSYVEFDNEIAEVESQSYGVVVNIHHIINDPIPGAYAGSYGDWVAPWYVDPAAGATKISYNNRTFLYNGADGGGDPHPGYVSAHWYLPGPPGTQYTTAGVPLAAPDTIYCAPLVAGAPFGLAALGVDVTAAGTGAAARLALYANDPATGRPGILLADTEPISISDEGFASARSNYYIGSPGLYWACILGTWSAAPSVISQRTFAGPSGWLLGYGAFTTMLGAKQPQGVSYGAAGLYDAGFPPSLSGLTADLASKPLPVVGWWQK